jgi:NADH-quinone oxidoreductase subunit L
MTIPLLVLAFMSVFSGFIPFSHLVSPDYKPFEAHFHWGLASASVGIGLVGIFFAWLFYKKENDLSDRFALAFGVFYKWTYHKFYIDELYMFITKKVIFQYISTPFAWFDRHVVDGTMNGIGNGTVWISEKIKGLQSGRVQDYAMYFVSGAVIIAMVLWFFVNN